MNEFVADGKLRADTQNVGERRQSYSTWVTKNVYTVEPLNLNCRITFNIPHVPLRAARVEDSLAR